MNKEELLKEIMKLPKVETINSISAMNVINFDDLMSAVDRFDKVPDYNDLLKENQELKKQQKEFIKYLEDESKEVYRDGGLRQNIFKQVLQKYKNILDYKDEQN